MLIGNYRQKHKRKAVKEHPRIALPYYPVPLSGTVINLVKGDTRRNPLPRIPDMKFLLLSCNTGGGHNTAAKAILEAAQNDGHTVVMKDFLSFGSERENRLICGSYISVVKHVPVIFGAFYQLGQTVSSLMRRGHSPLWLIAANIAPKLGDYLREENFDAVISTHFLAALALGFLKERGFPLPYTVTVATDYTCVPFSQEAKSDCYIIPHEGLTDEFIRRGVPAEKLHPCGIPVAEQFQNPPDRTEARKALGFPEDVPLYLIMGGSMGAGHLRGFTARLRRCISSDAHMAVICGNNDHLKKSMEKLFCKDARVHVIGYTNQVSVFMAACDVLYTKPGGLTSTEALVVHAPMVHTEPIPGCETKNRRFFRNNGFALPATTVHRQIRRGRMLAENPHRREEMRHCQRTGAKPDAASAIVRLAVKECTGREVMRKCEECTLTGDK